MKNMLKKIRKASERGQAIILIAFALVGMVAIVGLMIDGGILLIEYARLKRGIDAASIAAASQFRKGFVGADMRRAGEEFLKFNQSVSEVTIYTCNYPGTSWDATLCSPTGQPQRKLVRVTASRYVDFGFMRVIGMNGTTIRATSVGEAASIDMVLVIDTSASMAFETMVGGDPLRTDAATSTSPGDDPVICNAHMNDARTLHTRCEPMGNVKDAAVGFVDELFYPYDRVAVIASTEQTVGGNRNPTRVPAGTSFMDNYWDDDSNPATPEIENFEIQAAIRGLRVFTPATCPAPNSLGGCLAFSDTTGLYSGQDCTPLRTTYDDATDSGDRTTCGSSNIGGGLYMAGDTFLEARQSSFWVVIALIGGPANATNAVNGHPNGLCPGSLGNETWKFSTGSGYCRFRDHTPYNPLTDRHWTTVDNTIPANPVLVFPSDYDADDYARDAADYIAAPDRVGATLFSICMGSYCQNYPSPDPLSAEHLGQYMALSAGDDLTVTPHVIANHGLYFCAEGGTGCSDTLGGVFARIAENIFTRISQ
jgi:hypothetical protein